MQLNTTTAVCTPVGRACRQVCLAAQRDDQAMGRRQLLESTAVLAGSSLLCSSPAVAVMGMQPGLQDKNKGLSPDPEKEGFYVYQRPEEKMGGHGIGWTEIPRYKFKVPEGWNEKPTSIADLGGTEIDLRYTSDNDTGTLSVVLAPIARFLDIQYNSDIRLDQLAAPERLIQGAGCHYCVGMGTQVSGGRQHHCAQQYIPISSHLRFSTELFGKPLEEDDITNIRKDWHDGLAYYWYDLKPHNLVAITSLGNRVFILTIFANSRQWRKAGKDLRVIQESFTVPTDIYDMQRENYVVPEDNPLAYRG